MDDASNDSQNYQIICESEGTDSAWQSSKGLKIVWGGDANKI